MSNDSYKKWHKPNTSENAKTKQGYYFVKNTEKYVGDPRLVIYRSSWEYSFCKWCDYSPSIVRWASEPVKVPFYDKVTKANECRKLGLNPNNPRNWIIKNYNIDFLVEVKKDENTIEKWYIEIKPKKKLFKPKPVKKTAPLKEQRKFNNAAKEYMLNEEKFAAMKAYANRQNAKFYVFTEDQLRHYGIIGGRFDLKPINEKKK